MAMPCDSDSSGVGSRADRLRSCMHASTMEETEYCIDMGSVLCIQRTVVSVSFWGPGPCPIVL